MHPAPSLTVGVYMRERFADGARTLAAIVRGTDVPYTLVIVDCGAPELYRAAMERAVAGVPNVVWIHPGRFLRINESKALIAQATRDDMVAFVENACLVPEGWASAMIEAGRSLDAGVIVPKLFERTWHGPVQHHDRGFVDLAIEGTPESPAYRCVANDALFRARWDAKEPVLVRTLEAHLLLCSRDVLDQVGTGDPALSIGTHIDLSVGLAAQGIRVALASGVQVEHLPTVHLRPDERAFFAFRWDMDRARESLRILREECRIADVPDIAAFAEGQSHRIHPLTWAMYRLRKAPVHGIRRLSSGWRGMDQFYRDSFTVFSTAMAAAFLSYLFHPVLARVLTLGQYGEVQALLSLYGLLGVFLGLFSTTAANIVANADEHDHADAAERRRLMTALRNIVFLVSGVGFIAVVALSGPLGRYFKFVSPAPIVALAVALAVSVPLSFRRAFMRGNRRFGEIGYSQIVENTARLLFAATLAYIGWKATGAIAGVVLSQMVALAIVLRLTKKDALYAPGVGLALDTSVRRELRFAAMVFTVSATTSFFGVADVLVVKRLFSPDVAGTYAGIATVAKVIFFASGAASSALFPSVKLRAAPEANARLYKKGIQLSLLVGGAGAALFSLFPTLAVQGFVGHRFVASAGLLPRLSLYMLVVAMVSPTLQYHAALRRPFVAYVGPAAAGLTLLLCTVAAPTTLAGVVDRFTVSALILLATLGAFAVFRKPYAATA